MVARVVDVIVASNRVVEVQAGVQGASGPPGPAGPQGPAGAAAQSYTHVQAVPASTWVIEHGLGFWPTVYVLDTNGDECVGDVVNSPDMTRTDIIFSAPFAGRARLT